MLSDLERILALPRYDPDWTPGDISNGVVCPHSGVFIPLRRPGGTQTLRPIQAKALWYAALWRGLVGYIGVGHGKTLINLLIPVVTRARKPLLLIPAKTRQDVNAQWEKYARHWYLPENLEIKSYSGISSKTGALALIDGGYDCIVCDEAHLLKDKKARRTARFLKYLQRVPTTSLYVSSGSLAARSLKEYAHLSTCALGPYSPLPISHNELELFSSAIDVQKEAPDPVALRALEPLRKAFKAPSIREAYQKRFVSSPGVVATTDAGVDAKISIHKLKPEVPEAIQEHLGRLAEEWVTPYGDMIDYALEYHRTARQLAQGFFYRWKWPNNEPDKEWLNARYGWNSNLREYLEHAPDGCDSPALLYDACAAKATGASLSFRLPDSLFDSWGKWQTVRDRWKPHPPVETIWLDYYLVRHVLDWIRQAPEPALVWYGAEAFGAAVAHCGGLPWIGTGAEANRYLASVKEAHHLPVSIKAHGTGKNLQPWSRNLVTDAIANGGLWEQLIGRTHRTGQEAERIYVDVYAHTDVYKDAIKSARADALFMEQTQGTMPRLRLADWSG